MTQTNKIFEDSVPAQTRYFLNDENRVRTRAEFLNTYKTATPIKQRGVMVFVLNRNDAPAQTRLGITASKKTIGKAHTRNLLRRRVREVFRLTLPQLKPGHTIIVNLTRKALLLDSEQLRTSLHIAWHKAKLFRTDDDNAANLPQPEEGDTTWEHAVTMETKQNQTELANTLALIESPFRLIMLGIVKLYRLIISPIMPPICRFHPSCSAYGLECLQTLPFHKALPLLIWRIIRCNPLCKGGYDPVPNGRHPRIPADDTTH